MNLLKKQNSKFQLKSGFKDNAIKMINMQPRLTILVLLEWSESKSDGKLGFSMLKNPLMQILGAIGATSGI